MIRSARLLVLVVASAPLWGPVSPAPAAEIPADWQVDNRRQTLSTTGAESIEIRNPHGDVRVRPTDQSEISYSAMLQRHADDPRQAEIRGQAEGSTFRLDVVNPESPAAEESPPAWQKRRVDLTVFVPAKTGLLVETSRGLIEVKGIDRQVTARSESGDIVLASARAVSASTGQGAITVRFTATDWRRPSELSTTTGPISVTLPQGADTAVTMKSSGEMTTDFTLTIERPESGSQKTGRAVIGDGASELLLLSNRGSLKLLRSPF